MKRMVKAVWKPTAIILGAIILVYISYGLLTAQDRKIKFLQKYLSDKASITLIVYCDKYNVDWIKVLALLYSESEGKQKARSRNRNGSRDYGYMQLNGSGTLQHLRQRLKEHIDDVGKYSTEFNIGGGILHLRSMLDYVDENYYRAAELYNIGIGSYREGKRNNRHLEKWITYYTYFKYEYLDDNKFLGIFDRKNI